MTFVEALLIAIHISSTNLKAKIVLSVYLIETSSIIAIISSTQ